jgi:hypothetical protein
MRIFCFEKNIYLNSIKNDHADGCRSGCGLIRSILGILELSSEQNHTFITISKSWFFNEFPLLEAGEREAGGLQSSNANVNVNISTSAHPHPHCTWNTSA